MWRKTFLIVSVCTLSFSIHGQILGPRPATQTEVDAGVLTRPYVSPATLSGWSGGGGSSSNTSTVISTNALITAVPSATIGGTNVLEVVNQDTNKVFQVGTNGNVYVVGNQTNTGFLRVSSTLYPAGNVNVGDGDVNIGAGYAGVSVYQSYGFKFGGRSQMLSPANGRLRFVNADDSAGSSGEFLSLTATNGFASYTTAATNTVAATGWTNTFGVNAKVRITGTAVAVTIKAADESVLDSYTLGTADTVVELLQPLQAITAASGLVGTAKPF